jgi:hypothetical protein
LFLYDGNTKLIARLPVKVIYTVKKNKQTCYNACSSPSQDYRGMTEDHRASTNLTNQSLIRRFNHHSTMVLRATQSEAPAENGAAGKGDGQEPDGKGSSAVVENGHHSSGSSKRQAGEEANEGKTVNKKVQRCEQVM